MASASHTYQHTTLGLGLDSLNLRFRVFSLVIISNVITLHLPTISNV